MVLNTVRMTTQTAERNGIKQFFRAEGSALTHYLQAKDGRKSKEVGYSSICQLDGMFGLSAYWSNKEGIHTAEEAMQVIAHSNEEV